MQYIVYTSLPDEGGSEDTIDVVAIVDDEEKAAALVNRLNRDERFQEAESLLIKYEPYNDALDVDFDSVASRVLAVLDREGLLYDNEDEDDEESDEDGEE